MTEVQRVSVDVSSDQTLAWSHFGHMSFDDFSRSDTVSHWKMTKIMEAGRLFGLRAGVVDYSTIVNDRFTTFELGAVYQCDDALWRIPLGTQFPYKISLELEDVGKTSVTLSSRLVNKLDNKTLVHHRGKIVYVDRKSHRPAPLPEWVLEKYKTVQSQNKRPLALPRTSPQAPENAYGYTVTVAASDTDFNGHTNQASYFRYCCDASQAAVKDGKLKEFGPDISRYPLQGITSVFPGESGLGDTLRVLLWQQDGRPEVVRYVIVREEGQKPVIFHATMTYGLSPVTSSRL